LTAVGFAIALTLLVASGVLAYLTSRRQAEEAAWVAHSHEVIETLAKLEASVAGMESSRRGYLLTGDTALLGRFTGGLSGHRQVLDDLRRLTADNPDQRRRLDRLEPLVSARISLLHEGLELQARDPAATGGQQALIREGDNLTSRLLAVTAAMIGEERRLLSTRQDEMEAGVRRTGAAVALSAALAIFLLLLVHRLLLAEIARRERLDADRQRAEQERDSFFNASLDLLVIASLDGYFTRVNPAWQRTLGWSEAELLARPWIDFVHPDDVDATTQARNELEHGEDVLKFENRYRATDGTYRWLSWRVSAPEPGSRTLYAAARDVTAARGAADEMARLNRLLAEKVEEVSAANHELEGFSYSVSHDLRAPLRAIDGFSRFLADDHAAQLDTEGLRLLGVIRANIERMGRLIDDLLAFSRTGRQVMQKTRVDMDGLLRATIDDLKPALGMHPVDLQAGPLPPALGDAAMLRQVLVNLLQNAVKYTRTKSPAVIAVQGRRHPGEIEYTVADNGIGFDMKYVDKLFGVFQRLHSGAEYEGTGVGLALVQRIIHRHGGRVWVDAKPGQGATFHFALPEPGSES
jgi:PAS domain S-box-containing protein